MDISALSSAGSGSTKLIEAFERMGLSQGEGLISSGPSPVPRELAQKFEMLMAQSDGSASQGNTPAPQPENGIPAGESFQPSNAAASSGVSPLDKTVYHSDGDTSHIDSIQKSGADDVSSVEFTPEELYHIQFLTAMFRLQTETASQVSQQTAQGLDSLLRAQS